MSKELMVSMQTSGWLNQYFGGEPNAEKAFEWINSFGFDAVDYNIDTKYQPHEIKDGKISAFYSQSIEALLEYYTPVKEASEKTGVAIAQAHAPFPLHVDGNTAVNDFMIEVVEKCCAICKHIGCPYLVVHPWSDRDRDREEEINFDMFRRMIPAAKKYGIVLCIENLQRSSYYKLLAGGASSVVSAINYVDTLNSEAGEEVFGFCYDIGHATTTRRHVYEDVRKLGSRIKVLHLHDNNAFDDQHLAPMTQRTVDWEGFIKGLQSFGYRGPVNFESCASIKKIPEDLIPATLRYTAAVGEYIRNRLLAE